MPPNPPSPVEDQHVVVNRAWCTVSCAWWWACMVNFVALPPRTEVPELTARRGCVLASSAGYQLSALLAV